MDKLSVRGTTETEAALRAAPEDEYMSPAQVAFFRQRLRAEEEALLSAVKETAGHLQESEVSADWSDRASTEEEHTLELRVRDRERKLLQKIREALRRIDDGNYGWCEETGEPIGIARLLARPTASLCLEAQERREQSKRRFGG
ncbi:MAG: DnaK suppressor protein [Candidatus Accumulibacter regalis]|jgi:DnaK suppressor protein|uniref:RNA polymerase-binding transcription factor DksA n=1 Tax=Accumulibacter regalis TaxID=522306 RepID=A0A011RGG1_ACCRE|nr:MULTISPECIES: RNA polymerase-binding protein DksA [unclassified Candidatus Accumulibacter]EXI90304.1 MAG: DnaK suppressor protein [Candidatus Accumulibacter regalis]MQM33251.1 RNA polymerase-binding protein DksA [Candidatus Accumulibacter phosphatis]MBL8369001.1 RNA polymerase-binding protein DksA [Accumulibacter sp.]MBN8513195.1 RNA polymerase-binding protein DksA [Accumulibacter sp.]MBO3704593.1 RNA polymerase-binding protein DksA [Accumulibacter sp.]